jgi:hypothetical protein
VDEEDERDEEDEEDDDGAEALVDRYSKLLFNRFKSHSLLSDVANLRMTLSNFAKFGNAADLNAMVGRCV